MEPWPNLTLKRCKRQVSSSGNFLKKSFTVCFISISYTYIIGEVIPDAKGVIALLQAGNSLSNYMNVPRLISANGGSYGGFIKLKAPTIQPAPSGFMPIELQATGS